MSVVTLTAGSIFAGRYKVVRCIAAGGMGAVYEVVHVETERHRALKVMLPHLVESDDMRERFRREARVAAQIQSAYIVDVFDAGIDETTKMPFLVMELLTGEELGKRLNRVRKFEFEATVGYLWQTALALDKTHRANIVHRDLKPENLFLCEDDDGPPKIKVLDFGIAKIVAEGGTQANATRAMGTPLYMAPEQFMSKSKVSPATDIYALGMMAYTLVVGAPYWADEQAAESNPYAFAGAVMHGPQEPPTVRALRKGMRLPAAFDEWFAQATSAQPEQRFFKATVAIMGLASALGVPVPTSSAARAAPAAEPQGTSAASGQTPPGQTPPGQTESRQTESRQPGSGPQGTVPLAEPTAPMPGTIASGYGVSATQPKAASEPRIETPHTGPLQDASKRGKTLPVVIAVGVALCLMAFGVVMLGGKNNGPVINAGTAVSASVPSATVVPSAPAVGPVVSVVEPAVAVPEPVDAGTPTDAGPAIAKSPPVVNTVTVKPSSSKGTTSTPNTSKYVRD